MFTVVALLDRAKRIAGVESDYALAKVSGIGNRTISNYRTGRSAPDARALIVLCALSGDDPEHVAACIQAIRASNDDEVGLWLRIAERLRTGRQGAGLPEQTS
jgi:transcriptional regulator with XRE-family HTH domain